ncbi:LPS assembly protein LptD [Psychrobacter sp. HD31]|uniref:LPS-assembly protein LptD n=1 Tax=Psychrobacter sp. HD31 TaxID=3112003 RepID=UPI003DA360F7
MPLLHSRLSRSIRLVLFTTKPNNACPIIKTTHIKKTGFAILSLGLATTTHAQEITDNRITTYDYAQSQINNDSVNTVRPFMPEVLPDMAKKHIQEQHIDGVNDTKVITREAKAEKKAQTIEQKSLKTLSQYYQPIDKLIQKQPSEPSLNDVTHIDETTPIQQQYNQAKKRYTEITNAPRCEGVWVYPNAHNSMSHASNNNNLAHNNTDNSPSGTDFHNTDYEGNPIPKGYTHARADYGYYDNKNYAELSGNVVINQAGQIIKAEKVTLDLTTNVANAEGQVLFSNGVPGVTSDNPKNNHTIDGTTSLNEIKDNKQGGLIGVAEQLTYDPNNKVANAKEVAFASVPMQAHGYAQQMNKTSDNQYNLQNVIFSTCSPNKRKWHLDANNIKLDTDSGRGVAYNTTLNVANLPVLYLPYFNFPIDDRRTSGFLTPNASFNSERGFEVNIPYYLNLAPNYDATLNTRVFTNRNPMLTTEFRYLTDSFGAGRIVGSYLPKDKKYKDENRSSVFYEHFWASPHIKNLTADAEYSYVSDPDYIDDFDSLNRNINNDANLPRRASVNYFNDYIDAELKVETYQELEAEDVYGNLIKDVDRPYAKLPQLVVDYRLPSFNRDSNQAQFGNIVVDGTHDTGYFKKSIEDGSGVEKSGVRMYNRLSASYPITRPWGYVTPKLSLQHILASYDTDSLSANNINKEDGTKSIFVPQASIDAGLTLYQKGAPVKWLGNKTNQQNGYQLLSPRLKYTYAPFKEQNDLPNFNTRVASMSYDQLYADTWFLGHDRLQDLHAITPGVNYRYIDATGRTRLDASMAQQFYLDSGRVSLDDLSDDVTDTQLFNEDSSGLITSIKAQPYNDLWIDIDTALTNDYDLNFVTSQLRYQPTNNGLFSFGWTERKANENTNQLPLSAITASAIMPITNKWRLMAQGQYDTLSNQMLDSIYGVDYEDCCIGFSIYGRHYYNDLDLDDSTDSVMAELRLKGLSDDSSRLARLLSNRIYGFDPVQSAWKK